MHKYPPTNNQDHLQQQQQESPDSSMHSLLTKATRLTSRRNVVFGSRFISNYYNYFPETLPNGPPPKGPFDIDLKKLKAEYLRAQRQAHPDVSQGDSQVTSAELGTAFRILQNPVTRAEHILALQNENPLEEGNASLENEDLLMEIMMAREYMSEAESKEELDPLYKQNDERWHAAVQAISSALEKGDIPTASAKLVELSYWNKMRDSLDEKYEELAKL